MLGIILIALAAVAMVYILLRMEKNTRNSVEGLQSLLWELRDELRREREELHTTRKELKLEIFKEAGHKHFMKEMTVPEALKLNEGSREIFKNHGLICNECGTVPDVSIEEAASELNLNLEGLMNDLSALDAEHHAAA